MTAILLISSFVTTTFGIVVFRKLASRTKRLLDIPNERSSHDRPMIRGAGLVIVACVLGFYVASAGSEANLTFIALSALVAAVGFVDDLLSLALIPRLIIHFVTAITLVCSSGLFERLTFFGTPFGLVGAAFLVLFIVWTTNAFNFMDGIDGIAGAQGIAAGLGWMIFGTVSGTREIEYLGAAILGSCGGFLIFNWQPAKVFMGDVGSTFLGFALASIPLIQPEATSRSVGYEICLAVSFLWLFLFDTIFTRSVQVLSGERFWRSHRAHIYQKLVIRGSPHQSVALFYGICAIVISISAAFGSDIGNGWAIGFIALCPVLLLFWVRKKEIDLNVS